LSQSSIEQLDNKGDSMFHMSNERFVYEALTRRNYFPNQKSAISELPPCFTTISFTPEVAEKLVASKVPENRPKLGYDLVEYFASRHNNVPRTLSLVHPRAYSQLAKIIHDHWGEINFITKNSRSMIAPEYHQDGRLMIMNYEDPEDKTVRALNDGFGSRFRAHTDISGCFHGIYTHSIQWALLGFDAAKAAIGAKFKDRHWSDALDKYQRMSKRNETQGIPIGPATSSIVVEIILGKVDQDLEAKGFNFRRHIDDYVCYCQTYEQAESFLWTLGSLLREYKLNLNSHKTSVIELPCPLHEDWISEISGALPNKIISDDFSRRNLTSYEIIPFLDFAVNLGRKHRQANVVKYAVSCIINSIHPHGSSLVFEYLLNLSWHFPLVLPYLDSLMSVADFDVQKYTEQLNEILIENARHNRSDGMAWVLYYQIKFKLEIDIQAVEQVLMSRDCIAILLLYYTGQAADKVIAFSESLKAENDFVKDNYWILLYQLYREGQSGNPYEGDECFTLLASHDVSFVEFEGRHTRAQEYCNYLNNPFADQERLQDFDTWVKQA
jgi:hypothetical protein